MDEVGETSPRPAAKLVHYRTTVETDVIDKHIGLHMIHALLTENEGKGTAQLWLIPPTVGSGIPERDSFDGYHLLCFESINELSTFFNYLVSDF